MKRLGLWPRSERGATVVLVAISMVVLMGMAGLAIDLGMLQKTRAEAQRAADAAALAGASAYLLPTAPGLVYADTAVRRAKVLADANSMAGAKIDTASEVTVLPNVPARQVEVLVRRAAIPTFFARIFGYTSFPVGARATAEASEDGSVPCTKPIALPDAWVDLTLNGNWDKAPPDDFRRYDPRTPPGWACPPGAVNCPVDEGTGLGSRARDFDLTDIYTRDLGRPMILRGGNANNTENVDNQGGKSNPDGRKGILDPCPGGNWGGKCLFPSYWGWWQPQPQDYFVEGVCAPAGLVGAPYPTYSGNMAVAVRAIGDLIDKDKNATWNPNWRVPGEQPIINVDPKYGSWEHSPRVWVVGLFNPNQVPLVPGAKMDSVTFHNFARVFAEGCIDKFDRWKNCQGGNVDVVARFLGSWAPGAGNTVVRTLRLVK